MGVKCIWHWKVDNATDELTRIHDHLTNNLKATKLKPLNNISSYEIQSNSSLKYPPKNNSGWFRVCEMLSFKKPTITGTGGGISTKIKDAHFKFKVKLHDLPPFTSNPNHFVTNTSTIDTNTCYKVSLSESRENVYYTTPFCPNADLLIPYDDLPFNERIHKITEDLLSDAPLHDGSVPTFGDPPPFDPDSNADLKVKKLPFPGYLTAVDETLEHEVFECGVMMSSVVEKTRCMNRRRVYHVSGDTFIYRDFIVRIGSVYIDDSKLRDHVVVEIEHMHHTSPSLSPAFFTMAFNECVPQASEIFFMETNSYFSPCFNHDMRDLNDNQTLSHFLTNNTNNTHVLKSAVSTSNGQPVNNSVIGLRISSAYLVANDMYLLDPDKYSFKHTNLQYIQLFLHVHNTNKLG